MNTLQLRLIRFSVDVYQLTQDYKNEPILTDLLNQLLRSASSVGANYSEAQAASSTRDFHNKIRIALKELKETQYWLFILREGENHVIKVQNLAQESEELIRILSTICKKTDPSKKV